MNKFIIFIIAFIVSWIVIGFISKIIQKTELLFWIKMRVTIWELIRSLNNMYYYICYKSDYLRQNEKEITKEQINKLEEEIKNSAQSFLETAQKYTKEDDVGYEYFSKKEILHLNSMIEDVKNILKLLN